SASDSNILLSAFISGGCFGRHTRSAQINGDERPPGQPQENQPGLPQAHGGPPRDPRRRYTARHPSEHGVAQLNNNQRSESAIAWNNKPSSGEPFATWAAREGVAEARPRRTCPSPASADKIAVASGATACARAGTSLG